MHAEGGAFGARLLPNFWNRCGSNNQPTPVGGSMERQVIMHGKLSLGLQG